MTTPDHTSGGEEVPLTADAFAVPAASRRSVTPRRLAQVPPPAPEEAAGEDAAPTASQDPAAAPGTYPAPVPAGPEPVYGPPQGQPWPYTAPAQPGPGPSYPQSFAGPAQQGQAAGPDYGYDAFAAAAAQSAAASPPEWGWRGWVRRKTGGLITPQAGRDEVAYREALHQVQSTFMGPRTIVFVNPKGGASTTTSTLLAARTLGVHRGGGVIAWDNNETRGTLGSRAIPARHINTARELLDNIAMFEDSATTRIGDLGLYVRGQGPAFFDVLASDERAEVTGHIAPDDVERLHRLFQRFYRLVLIDTGNNMRAANWLKAVHSADLVVVTTTIRQDAASSALWMLDALERDVYGPGGLKPKAITVLAEPAPEYDHRLRAMMENTFGARTRAVCPIPYDPALVDGGVINYDRLSQRTHSAWLFACAAMASAL